MEKCIIQFMGMTCGKYGSLERYNIELASQLYKKGYKVIFVYNEYPSVEFYIKKIEEMNASIIELRTDKGFLSLALGIIKILFTYKPEVVHNHFNFPLARLTLFFSTLFLIPQRYLTIHSIPSNTSILSRISFYFISKCTSKIITVSDAAKFFLINKLNVRAEDIETIYLGINIAEFENKIDKTKLTKFDIPKDKKIVGCIAFHNPVKGIDVLLDAMNIIKNKYHRNDVVLCQVGGYYSGYYYTKFLEERTTQLNIEDIVLWLGIQNNIPEIIPFFDVYVQPSRNEGLGLTIVEAFASRLPVVGTNVGGIPEVVIDGENGFIVESEDSEMMANKILYILDNEEVSAKFGERGNSYIKEKFDINTQVKKVVGKYFHV
jgi:L-malate glycosyltransferase